MHHQHHQHRHHLAALLTASLLALAACVGAGPDDADEAATSDELRASDDFNHPYQNHNDQCVAPRAGLTAVPLYFADGTPTGEVVRVDQLLHEDSPCPTGTLQLDARETITTPDGRRLYMHRGGHGYVRQGTVPYGHVWIGDLARGPDVIPSAARNGEPCPIARDPAIAGPWRVDVHPIPAQRYWESNHQGTIGYANYGDADFTHGAPVDYTFMTWSWINVPAGGVVRTILPQGQRFERCDVRSVRLDSVDSSGRADGWVQAVYGRAVVGGRGLYGWVVYAHQLDGEPAPTYHLVRASDATTPTPDPMGTPAPMDPPPPPATGTCFVRCCDGTLQRAETTSDAQCRDEYPLCGAAGHGPVLRMQRGGSYVYERATACP